MDRLKRFLTYRNARYDNDKACCCDSCCPSWCCLTGSWCRPHPIFLDLTTNVAILPWFPTLIFFYAVSHLAFAARETFTATDSLSIDDIVQESAALVFIVLPSLRANHPTTSRANCILSVVLAGLVIYFDVTEYNDSLGDDFGRILSAIELSLSAIVESILCGLLVYRLLSPRELGPWMEEIAREKVQYVTRLFRTRVPVWTPEQSKDALALRQVEVLLAEERNQENTNWVSSWCQPSVPSKVPQDPRKTISPSVAWTELINFNRLPQRFRIAFVISATGVISAAATLYYFLVVVYEPSLHLTWQSLMETVQQMEASGITLPSFFNTLTRTTMVLDALGAVKVGTLVALVLASVISMIQLVLLLKSTHDKLCKIRQGTLPHQSTLKALSSLQNADTYVGYQVLHTLLSFGLMTGTATVLFTALILMHSNDVFRHFMMDYVVEPLGYMLFGTVVNSLVRWFLYRRLTDGSLIVTSHACYSFFSLLFSITGIPMAIMGTLQRAGIVILLNTVMSCRLDWRIYPPSLIRLDTPHISFWSVLFVEETYNHPIALVFLAHMHRAVLDANTRSHCVISISHVNALEEDSISEQTGLLHGFTQEHSNEDLYPPLRSVYCAVYSTPHPTGVPMVRRIKVQQRFWLMVLLHYNPSLRHFRKQRRAPHPLMK